MSERDSDGLRWGLLGASRIAGRRFLPGVRAAGGKLHRVAASRLDRAEAFAGEHGVAHASGDYRALLDDPEVDAIYLSLASALHAEWLLEIGRAGKPCLCEKPLVMDASRLDELDRLFVQPGTPLMEAFMWRHHPQVAFARNLIEAGEIGDLKRIHATFSFSLDREEDYRWSSKLGGGALFDLGSYCVNAARLFFGSEPREVSVRAHFTEGDDAVDHSAAGWMAFGDDRLATFSCSYRSGFVQGLELVGSKSRLWLGRPWNNVRRDTRVTIDDGMERRRNLIQPADPFALMVKEFSRIVRGPSDKIGADVSTIAENGLDQAGVMAALGESAREGGAVTRVPSRIG